MPLPPAAVEHALGVRSRKHGMRATLGRGVAVEDLARRTGAAGVVVAGIDRDEEGRGPAFDEGGAEVETVAV